MILGILGAIVTILVLLNRLAEAGIDLGGLNPFLWRRRRRWRKKLDANPIYSIESPMEMASLLVTATAKIDGDISSEEKRTILSLFQSEFDVSKREAAGLLISSVHMIGRGDEIRSNLEKIISPSVDKFNEDQAQSTLKLMEKIGHVDSSDNELKNELIERTRKLFDIQFQPPDKWS